VTLQLAGGQPARGPELLSLKIFNTDSAQRNIFIYNGQLCSIQSYNKSHRASKKLFYTVRHFPPCVSSILYRYLLCIRPFVQWTEKELNIETEQPSYLWPARHRINIEDNSKEDNEDSEDDEDDEDDSIENNWQEVLKAQKQGY
jgi:hypothetical protein